MKQSTFSTFKAFCFTLIFALAIATGIGMTSCSGSKSEYQVTPPKPSQKDDGKEDEGQEVDPSEQEGDEGDQPGQEGEKEDSTTVKIDTVWYSNPVYSASVFADPSILRDGDTFYGYASANYYPIIKSKDMIHWEKIGTVFTETTRPRWLKETSGKDAQMWGPEIRKIHGKYYFYYTLTTGQGKGIGVATADSPEGPFTDHGKVIQDGDYGTKGRAMAGATYFCDDDGTQYLYWGSYKGIWVAELSDDALSVKYPCDSTKIKRVCGNAWEGSMFHKHGQYYYFIGSGGYCCSGENSDYNMQVGRATSPWGPFFNKKGVNLLNTAGTWMISEGNDYFVGPGSPGDLITDDLGRDFLPYHSYVKGRASALGRVLCIDEMHWNDETDGWPTLGEGNGPTSRAVAPWFK